MEAILRVDGGLILHFLDYVNILVGHMSSLRGKDVFPKKTKGLVM